jgi:hypothetical protein
VELSYRDYSVSSTYYGRKTESEWTSFEQRYKLGLQGYVYHPKLMYFKTSVTFRKETIDRKSVGNYDVKDITYDLSASFMATRPISLSVYVIKTDSTIEGAVTGSYDYISNFYGASLYFRNRKYPDIGLEYNHWDYTREREKGFRVMDVHPGEGLIIDKKRVKEKTDIDRFSIHVNGSLKTINTNYNITGYITDYASPFRNYTGENITANTYTVIRKENQLATSFQYSDIDFYKLTRYMASVRLFPIGRLHHRYEYEYLTSETGSIETDSHTISNYLRYRFSRLIFGTSQLRYRLGKRNGAREDSYDINIGLNYGRPIKDFDFTSYYKFNLGKDERRGEYKYMENSLGIGLSTGKFRLGKIYATYDIALRKYDFTFPVNEDDFFDLESEESSPVSAKTDSLEHKIRVGINGRGPGRAYWNIEAEGRFFDSENQGQEVVFWLGEEQWAEEIRHYTLTGDIGYPIGQRGLATVSASYLTGQTNSEDVEKYYYEVRLNYRLLRNLNCIAWWREEWRNKGWWAGRPTAETLRRTYGWKTREYQVEVYYSLHRIRISLEYKVYRLEEGPLSSDYKRLYLRLSRTF